MTSLDLSKEGTDGGELTVTGPRCEPWCARPPSVAATIATPWALNIHQTEQLHVVSPTESGYHESGNHSGAPSVQAGCPIMEGEHQLERDACLAIRVVGFSRRDGGRDQVRTIAVKDVILLYAIWRRGRVLECIVIFSGTQSCR